MKSIQAFEQFYREELKDSVLALETLRKIRSKKLRKILLSFVLASILVLFAIYGPVEDTDVRTIIIVGTIVAFLAVTTIFTHKINELNYKARFKAELIRPIIHFISEDLVYKPQNKISEKDFKKSRLFLQKHSIYDGDDFVVGTIDKTKFHFSELHVQRENNDKNRTKSTVFKGLFFIADFNKDFEGSTVLIPNNQLGGFTFFKKLYGITRREKLVKLEDPKFSKLFTCYSDDDIKARYILSPALMKRILDFKKKYPRNKVYISFVDSRLNIAISFSRNLLEPAYFNTLANFNMIKAYYEDIKFVVDIVDDLNLNTRIWSKK